MAAEGGPRGTEGEKDEDEDEDFVFEAEESSEQ